MQDALYLLAPKFTDPAYPGKIFYCWHCALLEGILASCPDRAGRIDVHRIGWPRPRSALVDRLGEAHQSLPVLIFAEGGFVDGKDEILCALTERHGFPHPHP